MNGESTLDGDLQEPPTKKVKKVPKIFDGTYFTITSQSDEQIDARCSVCEEVKKGKTTSTGNFLTHYKLKHPNQFEKLKEYLKKSHNGAEMNESKAAKQPPITEALQNTSTNSVRNNYKTELSSAFWQKYIELSSVN